MLALMFRSRARKMRRVRQAAGKDTSYPQSMRRVSDRELFENSQSLSVNGTPVIGLSGLTPVVVARKPN